MTSSLRPRRYRFTAIRQDGKVVKGVIAAESDSEVAENLLRSGLHVVALDPSRGAARLSRRPSAADHAIALSIFGELLDAGLPPGRALDALRDTAPATWTTGLDEACEALQQGASMATALANGALHLPPVVIGLLQAGERGIGLGVAVRQAANLMGRMASMREAIANALAYPLVLLVTGTGSVLLLVTVVLPKFATILRGMRVPLPLSTRLLLEGSAFVRQAMPFLLFSVLAGAVSLQLLKRTDDGQRALASASLRLPVIGSIFGALAVVRAMRTASALLAAGVPVPAALEYASNAAGNAAIATRLEDAAMDVRHGVPLSQALAATRAASPAVVRLARAGEEMGRLAEMLGHAATLEERRVDQTVRATVRLVEPAMILAFGAAIAAVASALFQAMYAIRPGA